MEEVEATIFDGDTVVVSSVPILLDMPDVPDAPAGASDGSGWQVHVALPLGLVLEPGVPMRIETADGRSGRAVIAEPPAVEGDRVLHVFTGIGPFVRSGG